MNLDDAFHDDLDEIVHRSLLPYRPVLPHVVAAALHAVAVTVLERSENLRPWVESLHAPRPPARIEDEPPAPTPSQVALLGGSAPARFLDLLADDLGVGTVYQPFEGAAGVHDVTDQAMRALAAHARKFVATPGSDAAQGVAAVLDLGAPILIASMLGASTGGWLLATRAVREHEAEVAAYFIYANDAFKRAELDEADRATFEDHYRTQTDPVILAERRRTSLPAELARRDAFLQRFRTAMVRGIAAFEEEAGPDPARADPRRPGKLRDYIEREAQGPRGKPS